ncbi:hypothetical protein CRYUN_Cryun17cG0058700 [Craigia yunnanensis]
MVHGERWRNENLPIGLCQRPFRPARPPNPQLVSPKEIPVPKNPGQSLHNLAHVELNAIDLAWDTVVADDVSRHFAWCSQRLAEIGFNYEDMHTQNQRSYQFMEIYLHITNFGESEKSSDNVAACLAAIRLVQEARGLDAGPCLVQKMVGFVDHRTSGIVARIVEEEISHVAVGVYWFISICHKMNRAPCSTFKGMTHDQQINKSRKRIKTIVSSFLRFMIGLLVLYPWRVSIQV